MKSLMTHYASVLLDSVTYEESDSALGQESVLGNETDSALGQESIQESCQESVLEEESVLEDESVLDQESVLEDESVLENESGPRSITIENEAGDTIVLKAYSTSQENRIVINAVDMSFYEFKGYLAEIGMVDDYDMIEKKHWNDIKTISCCSAFVGAISVMGMISWLILLTQSISA